MSADRRRTVGRRTRVAVVLVLAATLAPRTVESCGPFLPGAVFTFTNFPDPPWGEFVQGDLGIIQPTYRRALLVAAYRSLSGAPLDTAEQQAVLHVATGEGVFNPAPQPLDRYRAVPGSPYATYLNCAPDAFATAARTRAQREAQFGADSPEVAAWDRGQEAVFANCAGGESIPEPAPPNMPPLIQADRAYQIAAAHFYAGHFDVAKEQFLAIAADTTSPWHEWAPYLAARALIRKASLGAPEDAYVTVMTEAEKQLQDVLGNSQLGAVHPAARRLLDIVEFRLHPDQRQRELAPLLLAHAAPADFEQNLWDYTRLNARATAADDLSEWLAALRWRGDTPPAVTRWQETHALTWLVAALSTVKGSNASVPALLRAAAQVPPKSPGYPSVAFHRFRLLKEAGRAEEARQRLDTLLADEGGALPPSSRNLFLALRAQVARDLDEWLRYAPRLPAAVCENGEEGGGSGEMPPGDPAWMALTSTPSFDDDATTVLNERFPLSVLQEISARPTLPTNLGRDVTLTTWVRAALLERHDVGDAVAADLAERLPRWRADLQAYHRATDLAEKRFAAAFLMLKLPGSRPEIDAGVGRALGVDTIHEYRDNWWCAPAPPSNPTAPDVELAGMARPMRILFPDGTVPSPEFLTDPERAAARDESRALSSIDAAPNYLTRTVLAWATAHPRDPRVPEALHLAVRATRFGCSDQQTGALSETAFRLLHRRYPKSPWTAQTPYWFH